MHDAIPVTNWRTGNLAKNTFREKNVSEVKISVRDWNKIFSKSRLKY